MLMMQLIGVFAFSMCAKEMQTIDALLENLSIKTFVVINFLIEKSVITLRQF